MDVIKVFEKYQTDKNSSGHNYAPYYAKHLPETATKILEVGVDRGESIKIWLELYPKAHIWGLDLFEITDYPFQHDRVTWVKGSQTDGKLLGHLRGHAPFDFIVEDGSHNSRDQLITFYGLVNCSPLYIAEDLHCCNDEFFRQGMKYELTMLGQIESLFLETDFHLYDSKIAFIYAD